MAYDETDGYKVVAIKRVGKRDSHPIYRPTEITSDHVVNIMEMFMDGNDVVVVYEGMEVSLRHVTSLYVGPLKAFQIAAICKEESILPLHINVIAYRCVAGGWLAIHPSRALSVSWWTRLQRNIT